MSELEQQAINRCVAAINGEYNCDSRDVSVILNALSSALQRIEMMKDLHYAKTFRVETLPETTNAIENRQPPSPTLPTG